MSAPEQMHKYDVASIMGGLYGDGIIARKGAFSRQWAQEVGEDIEPLFQEAISRPGGAVGRGPNRWYVEIQPENLRGFVELATNPWVVAVCEAVLGPNYKIVEVGFDTPYPGSMNQPWHRDFPSPEETLVGRQLNSLAFNATTVDVYEDMGPFEIAPGTQWDDPADFKDGMFPPKSHYPRYEARVQQKMAKMGDISARTALCIHRGTANRSQTPRPVLVLGVDSPTGINATRHDLQVTKRYLEKLPDQVRNHLTYRLVDELEPIYQKHQIDGLVMGEPS